MKKVYGLTGGIACGKSTVAAMLVERGASVIDADQLARDVVAPGTDGLAAVLERFGAHLLRDDGTLDRPALGRIVFGDEAARRDLEAILHPRIAEASMGAIMAAQQDDGDPIFYDAALLVENDSWRHFAGLVVVACSPDTQVARLAHRDGLDASEARARLDAQLPIADKIAVADHVIDNDGPLDALAPRIDALLAELRA